MRLTRTEFIELVLTIKAWQTKDLISIREQVEKECDRRIKRDVSVEGVA